MAVGGYSSLSSSEVPSIQGASPVGQCPPGLDLPETRQSHVAFNTYDKKVIITDLTGHYHMGRAEANFSSTNMYEQRFCFSQVFGFVVRIAIMSI